MRALKGSSFGLNPFYFGVAATLRCVVLSSQLQFLSSAVVSADKFFSILGGICSPGAGSEAVTMAW